MSRERAVRVALASAVALLLLWLGVATTDTPQTTPPAAVSTAAHVEAAATSAPDEVSGVARVIESVLGFVRQISRSLERGDDIGAVVRLLIIVEVLIATLGAVGSVTAGGKVKAELIYRIVDVMGALFIIIALLLVAITAL